MQKILQIYPKIANFLIKIREILREIFVPQEKNNFLPGALRPKNLFWYAFLLLSVKIALIAIALILPATDFFSAIAAQRLVALINQERQIKNLTPLSLNNELNSVAGLKAGDMLTKDYFDHTSPEGKTPWYWFKKIGYNYVYAGENLAKGFNDTDAVFTAWMNSPTHRDNILNPNFKEMGLAVQTGQIQNREETMAVLVFGRPAAEIARALSASPAGTENAISSRPAAEVAPAFGSQGTSSQGGLDAISAGTDLQKDKTISAMGRPAADIALPFGSGPQGTKDSTSAKSSDSTSNNIGSGKTILAEQIALKTIPPIADITAPLPKLSGLWPAVPMEQGRNIDKDTAQRQTISAPERILGAFISKSDEISRTLYLYFTLFMAIALAVNIFVKIKIQYWATITATTMVILLSTVLIFI